MGGTSARVGCTVADHKLKRGKLKGRDPLKNERMETMLKEFREDIKAYGAGDQLVCVRACVCVFVFVGVQLLLSFLWRIKFWLVVSSL